MSDDFLYYQKINEEKKKLREENERRYMEQSKERLCKILQTKFLTTFIGDLSRFEKYFGYLWGHGSTELTQEQKEWKQVWDECRTAILDNGNSQKKAMENELKEYDVKWNKRRFQYILYPKTKE